MTKMKIKAHITCTGIFCPLLLVHKLVNLCSYFICCLVEKLNVEHQPSTSLGLFLTVRVMTQHGGMQSWLVEKLASYRLLVHVLD